MMACWDIALCNLTEVDQHFRGCSDDGGSLYLWNVGLLHTVPCSLTEVDWHFRCQLKQNYTVLYLRTLSSSYVLSWESEISHTLFTLLFNEEMMYTRVCSVDDEVCSFWQYVCKGLSLFHLLSLFAQIWSAILFSKYLPKNEYF